MRAVDGNKAVVLAASSSAFGLTGGKYALLVHVNAASGLTVGLQMMAADNTTFIACATARAHVNGFEVVDLPPGQYKWVISGSAGAGESFDLSATRIPGE